MVILMAVPMGASAAISTNNWSGVAFEGTDAFYAAGVVAYEADATAKLECSVTNGAGVDVLVKSAKIYFDFGTYDAVSPAGLPLLVKNGDSIPVRFEFTVPADATNQVLHAYKVVVVYENVNGPTAVNGVSLEDVPGAGVTYVLSNNAASIPSKPMVPDSEVIYYYDAAAHTMTPLALNSGYALNDYTGTITFTVAPTANVYASYKYTETVLVGNGINKVGYLVNSPVVAGSEIVCLVDSVAQTITTQASSAYTIDYGTGKITMVAAPTAWQTLNVYYQYGNAWTLSGTNFAVYSADQADAQALAAQWANMNVAGVPPVFWLPLSTTAGAQSLSDSKVLAAQAATKYAAGDFAGAKADYQYAVDGLNTAYTANAALNTTAETGVASLLTNAGGAVDSYGAKLDAEAGKAHLIGVFYIMLGVALLIASLGSILWAYSLLVVARGPRQL
jgi:hypothetical protein